MTLSVSDSWCGPIPLRIYHPAAPTELEQNAVLLYHGLRCSKDTVEREARIIAGAGMTVFAVDAPHHGARHSDVVGTMPDALSLDGHYVLLRLLREARDEFSALVDHVLGLGHRRVAMVGISFGGFIAFSAATVEPRLHAMVSILGTPDWTPRDGEVPDDLRDAVSESPLLRWDAFAPRPLMMLNGALDDNVRPEGARALAERLRPIYRAAGIESKLVHLEYPDTTHFVPEPQWDEMIDTATRFLSESFRPSHR